MEVLLEAAARFANWERMVTHRCAWCNRVADRDGVYRKDIRVSNTRVSTDGMCPTCGAEALVQISMRGMRRLNAAAA
jgi:hypothetical protein